MCALPQDRLLLVEDDEDLAQVMKQLLVDAGYAAVAALNPEAAFAAIAERAPDLILLDLRLGAASGEGVIERLAREGRKLPVVVLSASLDRARRARSLPGVVDVLVKPVEIDQLLAVVARHAPHRGDGASR